jgi:ferrous iron transport protein B
MSETTMVMAERSKAVAEDRCSGVVLVGRPNVGKSALFGALTRSYVAVSNYPGTTVEVSSGRTAVDGVQVPVLDTPGTHSFIPTSEEERVTRDMLLRRNGEVTVAVGDSKDLTRTLALALQVVEMDLPLVLCLNMADEAKARGIEIDHDALASELGIDVLPTVAVHRRGVARLRKALEAPHRGRARVEYPEPIERGVARLEPLLPESSIAPRSLALMVLAGDETLVDWLRRRASPELLRVIEDVRQDVRREFAEPVRYVINRARLRAASDLADRTVARSGTRRRESHRLASWFERVTVHPLWSLPFLAFVLYLAYWFVGVLGAGTLVGLLEEGLFGRWINPAAVSLAERWIPWEPLRALIVGEYGILTMALTYAFALILPIVGTFFIAFGILEDSGYLPRLAVVLNRAFRLMGLNGKAVLPMVLGLGCDTMATLTTRILETSKERLIVIVLLSVGVPCSAQLTVILVMLGSISAAAVFIWAAILAGVIILVGTLAARVLPGRGSDFVVELPPMRLPQLSNVLLKTVARIEWYLKEAVPLFVLGTLILFGADRLGLLTAVRRAVQPVVVGWLGLPVETAEAFLIGFLRRDFGAAGLYQLAEAGRLDSVQVLVAAVTITLFVPCIAQFFMTVKERGWRTGLAIAVFVFAFALGTGAALNWLLRLLGVTL